MEFLQAIFRYIPDRWGDYASLAGLLVGVAGFAITIKAAWRSKIAAEGAEEAALAAQGAVFRIDQPAAIPAAIREVEEIKRLHRAEDWKMLPDRYSSVRQKLTKVHSLGSNLRPEIRASLLGIRNQMATLEEVLEKALHKEQAPPNVPRLNKILSDQADKLVEIQETFRQSSEEVTHG